MRVPGGHSAPYAAGPSGCDRRLRILFDLAYPGYLRYFDSVIKELAQRRHEVEVWFGKPEKQPEGVEALRDAPGVHVGGPIVRRRVRRTAVALPRTVSNYVRYLDPRFGDAVYLRRRAAGLLPRIATPLARLDRLPGPLVVPLTRFFLALERATPRSEEVDAFVRERRPDVVVVSPYVGGGRQADLVASARAAGVPTIAAIASWDNLTTKGLLRGMPDWIAVWNDAQAREAEELHLVTRHRIRITGAPPFDKWFGRTPSRSAEEFGARVGLPRNRPFVLFTGSTASISAPYAEQEFVRRWLLALRTSDDPVLRDVGVLVRPHPYNSLQWDDADLSRFGRATIWPRAGANPVDENDRNDYFDSIYHSAAVVGINTSAMIEAAIVGRPVLTLTPPEFRESQTGTLHFKHLLPENGGFVRRADSLDEHLCQLAETLRTPNAVDEELQAFVASFVRPHGLERAATPIFADIVEEAARSGVQPVSPTERWAHPALRLFFALDRLDACIDRARLSKSLGRRGRRDRKRLRDLGRRLEGAGVRLSTNPETGTWASAGRRAYGILERAGRRWEVVLRQTARRLEAPRKPATKHRESYGRLFLRQQRRREQHARGPTISAPATSPTRPALDAPADEEAD